MVCQLASLVVSPAILASPADTAAALAHLAWGDRLWLQLLITLKRLVIGLAIGAATGFVLGVLSGLEPRLRSFLEPGDRGLRREFIGFLTSPGRAGR